MTRNRRSLVSSWLLSLLLLNLFFFAPADNFANAKVATNVPTSSVSGQSGTSSSDLVRSMKLLAPNTGWVLTEQQLLSTSSNGQTWRDITPTSLKGNISDVFFLNPQQGWVIDGDSSGFQIAVTNDGGATWQTQAVAAAATTNSNYSGQANLDFVDAQHGFLMLKIATSVNFSEGDLFATNDGGKT